MKSHAFVIIALMVAVLILVNAIASLIRPIIQHYWVKYQNHKMLEQRRERFYTELAVLTQ